ncbi:CBS domain-containing protein [Desulfuromonas acetoxidans]|uniref:Cyclic nucleotide-binding protein n=1 Tax=Desulfuromonas acetoxidans (strain DSM 684 / 11070) TaxID=281689 RepID=Q1JYI8_DESA6|nr:putative nucleotidyltransferase substrate binding domain-containing protein [Desulfuromonas acetoxidans]EAT15218.1 cyclic nucleotide-binding protein [Desulfuromonas acetoxidans DSM 684]MBF0646680.1 CBS domain-containing protein [Desulfuromonas acetoxidans]NVD26000.1 CBS domain-containing protein [Desulfuromonas acetoxidans]NVE17904.1 CBS domain-containing protein [Desulfuromonas acetoxidans]
MSDLSLLRDREPFSHLPDELFEQLRASASIKKFPQHFHVFNQNDPFNGNLYVIKDGLVEITVLTPGGEEIVVDYRHPGSTFGCTPLFTGDPYTGGARTVKSTECFLLPQPLVVDVADKVPRFKAYFNHMVVDRVRHLYADIVAEHSQKALTQMESYPFKKRLSEIMSAPVLHCRTEASAREIAELMSQHQVRSVVVTDDGGSMVGMVTCRDVIGKVLAIKGADAETITASELMAEDPVSMSPQTYMYEAMAYMSGHKLKHLPIVDGGELVGMVSMSDLLRYRSQKAMIMIGSVEETDTIDGLAAIHRSLVRVASSLLSETRSAPEVMEILSYIHHALIKRTFELCWQQMIDEGHTPPNVRYCFLIMGSGGRREMLLGPDQDNGFIFENFPDWQQKEVDDFFIPLADKLVHALDDVGYPLCEGDVMASNEAWRGRLIDWRARIDDWAANPEPHKVRYSSIFFDFTPLVGDAGLAHSLQSIVFQSVREYPGFLYHVMQLNLTHKVPTGLWGRFTVEKSGDNKGKLSLKKGGLVYIVDCLRMFALEHEIRALTTLDRLRQLTEEHVFAEETAEHIRVAFEALSFLRLRNEISLLQNGEPASNYIDPNALSKTEQDLLRSSFDAVSKLQSATRSHFGKGLS